MDPNNFKISYKDLPWENTSAGMRQRYFSMNGLNIRHILIDESFDDPDLCCKNHFGLVLKGKFKIKFENSLVEYSEGDILWINQNKGSCHTLIADPESLTELIIFENDVGS